MTLCAKFDALDDGNYEIAFRLANGDRLVHVFKEDTSLQVCAIN